MAFVGDMFKMLRGSAKLFYGLLLFSADVCHIHAADVSGSVGKTGGAPLSFRTGAEYEEEAAQRIAGYILPDDVSAELFADASQTQNSTAICFDHQGRLYVAETHRWRAGVQDIRSEQQVLLQDIATTTNEERLAYIKADTATRPVSFYQEFEDRIVRIEDQDKDGRADASAVWADGFNDVLDGPGIGLVADADGSVYYTNIPHLWKLSDEDGDGKAEAQESLQDGFGVRMSYSGHDMHGVVIGPDGRLYWSIGDRGSNFVTKEGREVKRSYEGSVFRSEMDGSDLVEIYRGLRNPQELAFDKYGNLFTSDNNADAWDDARLVYIIEGGDSGWHFGHQVLMNFRRKLELRTPLYPHPDRSEFPVVPWITEGLWDLESEQRPVFALPPIAHVAWGPSGFVYNYGDTAMPERYADHFWICNFGGAKSDLEAFSVSNSGAGFALGNHEKFMEGTGNTDVEFGPDGKMYLSCFNNNGWYKQDLGNIYTLYNEELAASDRIKKTHALLTSDFRPKKGDELLGLLAHNDMRVRQRAQFALAEDGEVTTLLAATAETNPQLQRIHGIWGLGQLIRKDHALSEKVLPLLSDADPEIRAQTVRVLSEVRSESIGEALVELLDDESPRVVSLAAIGVGKVRYQPAFDLLVEGLRENADTDAFLRHSYVQGLFLLNDPQKLFKLTKDESASVRLGALLVARKLEDSRIYYFLKDSDQRVRWAAIRAISDLNIEEAVSELAAHLPSAQEEAAQAELDHYGWIIHHRLIGANFRDGSEESARRLLRYAADERIPELLRTQSLAALQEWGSPTPVDPTNGQYRPIDAAGRVSIDQVVQDGILSVLDVSSGDSLGKALELALASGTELPVETLQSVASQANAPEIARAVAIKGLSERFEEQFLGSVDALLSEKSQSVRAAAVQGLLQTDKDRGIGEVVSLIKSDQASSRKEGYRLAAGVEDESLDSLLLERMKQIKAERKPALLELIQAAKASSNDLVNTDVSAYEAMMADTTKPVLERYAFALAGGDVAEGKKVFLTHAAGQCAKCHRIEGEGGVAGPDLSTIARKNKAPYILESIIDPSAVVVGGYGMTMVTKTDGSTVGGAFLRDQEDGAVVLRQPDPSEAGAFNDIVIPKAEIASKQPPISAMPPMGYVLSNDELRDLVAYLASLDGKRRR